MAATRWQARLFPLSPFALFPYVSRCLVRDSPHAKLPPRNEDWTSPVSMHLLRHRGLLGLAGSRATEVRGITS